MTILKKRPLRVVALGALLVGTISCGSSSTDSTTAGTTAGATTTTTGGATTTTGGACPASGTFTQSLANGTDHLTGAASCANVFLADFSAGTNAVSPSDIIVGVGTNNTLKISGVDTTSLATFKTAYGKLPDSMTNVQTVEIATQLPAGDYNFTSLPKVYTSGENGVSLFKLNDVSLLAANTITTGPGQGLSLRTTGGVITAGAVIWAPGSSKTDTFHNLTFNGYQGALGVTPAAFSITNASAIATTLNIASMGADNATGTFTGLTTYTKHVITGDKPFKYALAAADVAKVASIDASASTGGVNASVAAATSPTGFTFTGGSGNDRLQFGTAGYTTAGALNLGTGTDDIFAVGGVAPFTAVPTNWTGVEQLEFTTAAATQNLALVGNGVLQFRYVAGGNIAVTNNESTYTHTLLTTDAGTFSATISNDGGTDILNMVLKGVDTGVITATNYETFNLVSNKNALGTVNGTATAGVNTVADIANSANSTITVTGDTNLTVTGAYDNQATFNASALTGNLSVTGSAGNDTITGGTGNDTMVGGAGNDTIVGGAGNDAINGSAGNDTMTGGAGVDAFTSGVAGQSTVASANTLAATIANGNTITFANSLDVVTDLVSGTDKLDVTTAAVAPTSLVGWTLATALVATTTYSLLGTWDSATKVFTVNSAATSATPNVATLVVVGDGTLTAANTTGYVLLLGVSTLVAADIL